MSGVWDDVRYSVRSLGRRPSLTVFAALTLALGIGSSTAIFSTVESVVLNPLPYPDADRIVSVSRQLGSARAFLTPTPEDVVAWSAETDVFERLEPWSIRSMTLTGRGEVSSVETALVRPGLFELIDRHAIVGRTFDDDELVGAAAKVVVLSHDFWVRGFGGSPDALGETLLLNGESWTVIGVLPRGTLLPGWGLLSVDVWRPLARSAMDEPTQVTALLREEVTVDQANERLAALGGSTSEGVEAVGHARLIAEQVGSGVRAYLGLLMGAVVLLLLIACVNVSNLLLFRANVRRRETAVRAALGGGRLRLARQLLVESLVLALLGGALGVALAYLGRAAILELRPTQLEVLDHVSINAPVLLFALGVTIGTAVLFGLIPALNVGRGGALAPLRSGHRIDGDVVGGRLRWFLVSGEVALSFTLLLGSLSILSTLVARQGADIGFEADEVLVMEVELPTWRYAADTDRERVYEQIVSRIRGLSGVARASRSNGVPPRTGVWFGNVEVEGAEPSEESEMLFGPHVDAGYFSTLGQRIVRGRAFTTDEVDGDEAVVIIGEETARAFFGDRDPVGSRFRMRAGSEWSTVVGVAADVPMVGLSSTAKQHQFYLPLRPGWGEATFLVRLGDGAGAEALLPLMRDVVTSIEPDARIDRLGVVAAMMGETLQRERFTTTLMGTFAVFALVLAAVGLFGVVSQVVGQRTREIGIRMALGARRREVAGMVVRGAGLAATTGVAVGIALAIGGSRLLDAKVYGLTQSPPGAYALAALCLAVVTLFAAYAPARRAAGIDPVEAIRVE